MGNHPLSNDRTVDFNTPLRPSQNCQKLGAVGLTALGRAQLCPAVAGGALLRLSLPGTRCSLRAICPYGAHLVNVDTVGAALLSTQAFTAR